MEDESICNLGAQADASATTVVELEPKTALQDYLQAMKLANEQAEILLGDNMLLSWYDRDRDFESPQHAGECHANSAVPGYVDYGLYHGATLRIDIHQGRFVFFYSPVELG